MTNQKTIEQAEREASQRQAEAAVSRRDVAELLARWRALHGYASGDQPYGAPPVVSGRPAAGGRTDG